MTKSNKPQVCPVCGSTNLDYSEPDVTDIGDQVGYTVECLDCNCTFDEWYDLKFAQQNVKSLNISTVGDLMKALSAVDPTLPIGLFNEINGEVSVIETVDRTITDRVDLNFNGAICTNEVEPNELFVKHQTELAKSLEDIRVALEELKDFKDNTQITNKDGKRQLNIKLPYYKVEGVINMLEWALVLTVIRIADTTKDINVYKEMKSLGRVKQYIAEINRTKDIRAYVNEHVYDVFMDSIG